jgi:hypothetical protein
MGHMNQFRQNIRSTSKTPISSDMEDVTVTPAGLGTRTHLVYAVLVDQGKLYTDLTRKIPGRSSKGNWYIMVCYVFDCNYVKWVKAYDIIHQELISKGFKPKLQTLDNEAYSALKNFFTTHDMEYQLFPPHFHWRNAAEWEIRTFKEHFVAVLASGDPYFPLHLCKRLLPQAEMTLNII